MGFAYNIIANQDLHDDGDLEDGKFSLVDQKKVGLSLLQRNECSVPERVLKTVDFFEKNGLWYILSRNSPATSCRDAVFRRLRNGTMGIPLYDELKSYFTTFINSYGEKQLLMLHCRAHEQFSVDKIRTLLGIDQPLEKLEPEELDDLFSAEYGTVNPFIFLKNSLQIFDQGVLMEQNPPHTMMTNAGNHTWGIEFDPKELVKLFQEKYPKQFLIEDITIRESLKRSKRSRIGIITGNGPESGMALWRHVNSFVDDNVKTHRGDLSYPPIIVHSIPEMGLSMELEPRIHEVWQHMSSGIQRLCEDGITHLALACHTTHYFTEKIRAICERYEVTFVSMAETAIRYIERQQLKDLTVIGIPYVADLAEWSSYQSLAELDIRPVGEKARKPLMDLGYMIKKITSYEDVEKAFARLTHILRVGVSTKNVLIALTEISILLEKKPKQQKKVGKTNIIDPLRLYGEELGRIYLDSLPKYTVDDREEA